MKKISLEKTMDQLKMLVVLGAITYIVLVVNIFSPLVLSSRDLVSLVRLPSSAQRTPEQVLLPVLETS